MDANLNLISPHLPDLNGQAELSATKKEEGPSFNSVLDQAAKKSEPAKSEPQNDKLGAKTAVERREVSQAPKTRKLSQNQAIAEPVQSPMRKEEIPTIDDKAGVVSESYDGMAVSYPVSRIAKDSLDENTVTDLKDQGLWELPTMVMAQPSQQLLMMKDAAKGFSVEDDAIPVAKPIVQFMASLENELGVSQDRLVQAFQKLPPGQMQLAPEKTMAQVVKNLSLSPKDEARAKLLFQKMLSQMQALEANPTPYLAAAVAGAGATQQSLQTEKIDEKGMMKGRAQAASKYALAQAPEKGAVPAQGKVDDVATQTVQKEQIVASRDTAAVKGAKPEALEPKSEPVKQAPLAPFQTQVNSTEVPQTQVVQQTPHTAATPDAFSAHAAAANQNAVDDKAVKELSKGGGKKETLNVKGVDATQASTTQIATNDLSVTKAEVQGGAVAGSGVASSELKAGNDSKHEAIRSIVNQAQMLAAKGGGEIRMSLKPEHLGEIQLKVAMEGNRVNVQMTTERGEVKKLIEQSVHELRHGLASHNLSMDKLDVSVGNKDTGGSFKGQPNFGATRDFANQFHQQQNSRREFAEDFGALRGSAQRSLATMDRAGQAQSMLRGNSTGRLNVVA